MILLRDMPEKKISKKFQRCMSLLMGILKKEKKKRMSKDEKNLKKFLTS